MKNINIIKNVILKKNGIPAFAEMTISLVLCLMTFALVSCEDFLDKPAYGFLAEDDLTGIEQVENMCVGAYATLANDDINHQQNLWGYGNVRADDAYKGGGGLDDNTELHWFEISSPSLDNQIGEPDVFWYRNYMAVSRINSAIRALQAIDEKKMPLKNTRIAEMRFLRAHFHFVNKICFKHIPYITEDLSTEDIAVESNVKYTSDEVWQKIAGDFDFAHKNLPPVQPEIGRANKYAAAAYLAKTYLYKAYRQDEMHNLTEINQAELQKVIELADEIIASPYHLESDFAYNFLPGNYENGAEAIFSVQYSKEDGTHFGRLNYGSTLCVPTIDFKSPNMDFHKPSQSLVNAFITQNGLPDADGYNATDYNEASNQVDPRLFHTVALPFKPYKYTGNEFTMQCARTPGLYGYYSSLKENVDPNSEYLQRTHDNFAWYANSKNWIVLRYADVLLWKAEALIESHRHSEALPIINELRNRAAQSLSLIAWAATFSNVQIYRDGANCTWTEDFARQALRWERRMEMSLEGSRFFDLVRWGIAAETMNAYYAKEKGAHSYYNGAQFVKNKHEYIPIPIQQLRWSKGLYKQNYGFPANN
ncbi:MAG: RagB/SusD family nutrient uptake outer membrane protein [Dysgonamonadaceae bacterium]|jgi:hypothetical protein|nr:RagB/SusD family nutrient uptake outer membrane protein [Dysgonamonadaceae bacterium]